MTLSRYCFMRETISLSQAEAADRVHGGVALNTVKKWDRGAIDAPAGVIRELQDLQRRLETAAEELRRAIESHAARHTRPQMIGGDGVSYPPARSPVPVGLPETPEDAYQLGFPSHQSMMRMIGTAVSRLAPDIPVEFRRIGDGPSVTVALPAREMAN